MQNSTGRSLMLLLTIARIGNEDKCNERASLSDLPPSQSFWKKQLAKRRKRRRLLSEGAIRTLLHPPKSCWAVGRGLGRWMTQRLLKQGQLCSPPGLAAFTFETMGLALPDLRTRMVAGTLCYSAALSPALLFPPDKCSLLPRFWLSFIHLVMTRFLTSSIGLNIYGCHHSG